MTTAMSPAQGDDDFSAFDSGLSEYESAESNVAEEEAGASNDDVAVAASNDGEDDFFDAFADAGAPVDEPTPGGEGVEGAEEVSEQPEVDLFSAPNEGSGPLQPAPEEDPSPPDSDPFSAFDDITPSKDAGSGPLDDFGAFGSADTESPTAIAEAPLSAEADAMESAADNGLDAPGPVPPTENVGALADDFGVFGSETESENPAAADATESAADIGLDAPDPVPPNEDPNETENPADLTKEDLSGISLTQPAPEQPSEASNVSDEGPKETEGGETGDALSAFDALGFQDAPLPSLDGFASISNEEGNLEVGADNAGDSKDGIDGIAIDSAEDLNGGNSSINDDAKENGADEMGIVGNSPIEADGDASNVPDDAAGDSFGGYASPTLETSLSVEEDQLEIGSPPQTLDLASGHFDNGDAPKDNFGVTGESYGILGDIGATNVDENFGAFAESEGGASGVIDVQDSSPFLQGAVHEEASETPIPNNSNDFGGFSTFEIASPSAVAPDGDFSGLASAETRPTPPTAMEGDLASKPLASVENGVENGAIDGIGAELGALDSHVSGEEGATMVPANDDSFGGFASIPTDVATEAESEQVVQDEVFPEAHDDTEKKEDDDFGGFTADADDFGDFKADGDSAEGAAASIDQNLPAPAENGASQPTDAVDPAFDASIETPGAVANSAPPVCEPPTDASVVVEDDGFGDFGGFSAVETPAQSDHHEQAPANDDIPANQLPADVSSAVDDEFGDFGDFAASGEGSKDTPPDSAPIQQELASVENEMPAIQPSLVVDSDEDEGFDDFGDFVVVEETAATNSPAIAQAESVEHESAPIEDEEPASRTSGDEGISTDEGFGDFGDFNAVESAATSSPEITSEDSDQKQMPTEDEDNQPSTVADSTDDDGFGDFGGFDEFGEAPVEDTPDQETTFERGPAEDEPMASQTAAVESAPDDDGFGDFGDFNAFEEAPGGELPDTTPNESVNSASTPAEGEAPSNEPSAAAAPTDDDEFGDFGGFDAFEEAAPAETSPEDVPCPDAVAPSSEPAQADNDDEFGDFGDFNEFEEAPEEATPKESIPAEVSEPETPAPAPAPVLVLNESVRSMFDDVFASDPPIASGSEARGICTELPFDVPICEVLPEQMPIDEEDPADSHRSEQELTKTKKFFEDLPRSPPLTILSDEKWYPYSQYEFHRDGSPYAESVERVTTPSVPEVLSIDLPTGFEASNLSPSSKPKQSNTASQPAATAYRSTPTVVDFPSTPKSERKIATGVKHNTEEGDDLDYSQLSAVGKRFMEQLPDLSYMLKSTLSLDGLKSSPNDKK